MQVNDYGALRDYLKKQRLPEFVLSFEEIEQIIDAPLPRAAHRASWWESVSAPSATTSMPRSCASAMIDLRITGRVPRLVVRTKDWSILMVSNGKRCK